MYSQTKMYSDTRYHFFYILLLVGAGRAAQLIEFLIAIRIMDAMIT